MTSEMESSYLPRVSVQLNRYKDRKGVLVTIIADPDDDDAVYYTKLECAEEYVGFALDPTNHPHEVQIVDDAGVYVGMFRLLDDFKGAFLATPPVELIDLLFPRGEMQVTLPCKATSGEYDLSFTLPEGRSLLSLFFEDPLPCTALPKEQPASDASMPLITV